MCFTLVSARPPLPPPPCRYFLSRAETVLRPDYLPSNQDIVQVRVKTTGIIEHDFEICMQGNNKRKLILVLKKEREPDQYWRSVFDPKSTSTFDV